MPEQFTQYKEVLVFKIDPALFPSITPFSFLFTYLPFSALFRYMRYILVSYYIPASTLTHFPSTSRNEVEKCVARFFKYAVDRDGGRDRRRMAKRTEEPVERKKSGAKRARVLVDDSDDSDSDSV